VITLICLAILFVEVSKLRTQNTSTAQSTTRGSGGRVEGGTLGHYAYIS
jgi:hypothetical protein